MHSNRSNPSQFRVSHLSRQSTVRLYCMAAVWYRYCNVWLLYGTNYCMVLYGTVWLQLYSCTVWYRTRTVWLLVLYGCMVPVLLYGCMVLYGCTAVWYCMGNILVDLAGSYLDLVGIPMPSAECMGLYRGGLLSNRSELDAMGGMPLGV